MEPTKVYLASLATFKSFYDNNMDIYSVISEFIKNTLYANPNIDSKKVKELLYDNYSFDIPLSVVRTTLRKLSKDDKVIIDNKNYILVDRDEINKFSDIENSNNKFIGLHDKIIESLTDFISGKIKNSIDINFLTNDFFKYIVNPYDESKYSKYIALYLAGNDLPDNIKELIQQIKDGEILLSGLSYQIDPNELETYRLKNNLTIYIDQELLFSSQGYNGVEYQEIFSDFLNLVKTINNLKNNNGKILLRFLPITRQDIDNFFYAAENIVNSSEAEKCIRVKSTAMFNIIKGAKNRSDILDKKVTFFNNLKKNGIVEDDNINIEILDKGENYQFNISNSDMVERFTSKGYSESDFYDYTKILNIINFLRNGNNNNSLENIRFIFLTATLGLLNLAWDKNAHERNNDVPLVTSIDFMINRFWFKTQKNIATIKPVSFDIALQAKLIVNSLINTNLSNEFEKIKEKIKREPSSYDVSFIAALKQVTERVFSNDFYFEDIDGDILERELEKIKLKDKEIENLRYENKNLKEIEESALELKRNNRELEEKLNGSILIDKDKLKRKFIFYTKFIILCFFVFLIIYCIYRFYPEANEIGGMLSILGIIISLLSLLSEKNRKKICNLFRFRD